MRTARRTIAGLTVAAAALLAAPAGAAAAVDAVFAGQTISREGAPCAAQPDGIRVCVGTHGGPGGRDLRLASHDGVPLAFFVTLPPAPAGADGPYPLVVQSHGWAAPPSGPDDRQYGGPTARELAADGYAVLQFAARGWGGSCGTPDARLAAPGPCAKGYIRLDDYRYEARDVQHAAGLLVDAGLADPERIGAMGESYGAGVSLALATLRDRVVLPDGSVAPWTSPNGTPLRLAAAAPFAGWSDLAYSLAPNGRTYDSQITPLTADLSPLGVQKLTIVTGLLAGGVLGGQYALPFTDPEADEVQWYLNTTKGEPYTGPLDGR